MFPGRSDRVSWFHCTYPNARATLNPTIARFSIRSVVPGHFASAHGDAANRRLPELFNLFDFTNASGFLAAEPALKELGEAETRREVVLESGATSVYSNRTPNRKVTHKGRLKLLFQRARS